MRSDFYDNIRRLNLNQFVAFLVVAEERSFRRAALRMSLSQSAVSVQIRQLEETLGLPLFHRTTRSVALTPAGEILQSLARTVCTDVSRLVIRFREEAQLQRGVVTVVALPATAVMLLPPVMRAYQDVRPGIEVKLMDLDSRTALEALRNGHADIGVLSRTEGMDDFDFELLQEDELVVVTLPDARKPGRVRVQDLARIPLILTPRGVQLRTLVDELFGKAGCVPDVCQECMRPQTLLALVEQGFGSAITTRSTLEPLDTSRVAIHGITPRAKRDLGVVTLHGSALAPAVASFREFLRERAQPSAPAVRRR